MKVSAYGVRQGASSPHIKFWDPNGGRKLRFGTLVGIYRY